MSSFDAPQLELADEQLGPDTRVITASGEVHVTTAPELSARLNDALGAGASGLVVDMSAVEFIDSTGLSVLLNALRRVTRSDGRLALVVSNPTVLRLFEVTRLDTTFDIHATRAGAIKRVQAAGGSGGGP